MPKKSKTVTSFDNTTVREILDKCEAVLRPIADEYGLTLDRKGRSYRRDALPVMFQLLVKITDEEGNALSAAAKEFLRHATIFGLSPEDLGKEFKTLKGTYRITGCAPRSRKYPILAENIKTGATFKFQAETVRLGLRLKAG